MFKLFIVLMNGVLEVDFGDELKRIRESRGMTVNQLAMYSEVSSATISRVENKKRGVPRPKYIKKLAEALKYPYADLMKLAGYSYDEIIEPSIEETEVERMIREMHELVDEVRTKEQAVSATIVLKSIIK